jgi:DNA-binding XRE family transcriptional regulator
MNKFAEWIKNNDKKQRGVADKIGVSTSTLHEILRKGLIPSLKVAYQIERYTRGAVTVYDWMDHLDDTEIIDPKTKSKTKMNKAIK